MGKTAIDAEKYKPSKKLKKKKTKAHLAALSREFCEQPARLGFWKKPLQANDITQAVFTNLTTIKDKTLTVVDDVAGRFPGSENNVYFSTLSNRKTLTVIDDGIALSGSQICNSPMSFGPDYVNFKERMFCAMETKTLVPILMWAQFSNQGD